MEAPWLTLDPLEGPLKVGPSSRSHKGQTVSLVLTSSGRHITATTKQFKFEEKLTVKSYTDLQPPLHDCQGENKCSSYI